MSLALHAEKNAKANYKILALEQSSGALTTYCVGKLSTRHQARPCNNK